MNALHVLLGEKKEEEVRKAEEQCAKETVPASLLRICSRAEHTHPLEDQRQRKSGGEGEIPRAQDEAEKEMDRQVLRMPSRYRLQNKIRASQGGLRGRGHLQGESPGQFEMRIHLLKKIAQ